MVKITVYNEKGGVGKTTVSYLLAGYLRYVKGRSVCVVDFDHPSYHFNEIRRSELATVQNPRSQLSMWLRGNPSPFSPYEIYKAPIGSDGRYDHFMIMQFIAALSDYDYIIYDFPGRFTEDEAVAILAANGMIDFVAIPTDTDVQSRKSALVVADAIHRQGIPCTVFWNRVTAYETRRGRERFIAGGEPFRRLGVEVMDEAIKDLKKFSRDSSEMMFVRSTLCFPQRYIDYWCPGAVPFLEALIGRIDNSTRK